MPPQHQEFRKVLQDSEVRGWQHFDDVVFKLSAGGLAVSLTLLGITNQVDPSSMRWLYGAWSFWAVSLLFLVASIWTGQQGLRSQIAKWDAGSYYTTPTPEGSIGALTPRLNVAAIVFCAFGLVWLLVFALHNVSAGGPLMPNNDTSQQQGAQYRTGGQVAPQAPLSGQKGQVAPQAPPLAVTGGTDQRGQVAPQAPPAGGVTLPGAGTVAPQAPPQAPVPTPQPPVDRQ